MTRRTAPFRERAALKPHPLPMNLTMTLAAVLLLAVSACGEKPQRVMNEPESANAAEDREVDMRQRTLRQGEAGRMAY